MPINKSTTITLNMLLTIPWPVYLLVKQMHASSLAAIWAIKWLARIRRVLIQSRMKIQEFFSTRIVRLSK